MAKEIERKFLVANDSWRSQATGKPYSQGYISTTEPGQTVRVRIVEAQGYLTLKGPTKGITRTEFEYPIPVEEAQEILKTMCGAVIKKIRYRLPIGSLVWEIDEFRGENAGLIVAEVELASETQKIDRPDWLGKEVSDDSRYYNASLSSQPYSTWVKKD